jgi:hypothetical protein
MLIVSALLAIGSGGSGPGIDMKGWVVTLFIYSFSFGWSVYCGLSLENKSKFGLYRIMLNFFHNLVRHYRETALLEFMKGVILVG